MKKYILAQLTQASFWIGVSIILLAVVAPRTYIMGFGVLLILVGDEIINKWLSKQSARLAAKIEEWTK